MPDIREEIQRLKAEQDAVILAHYYQRPEIQDIADIVGDSLALAQAATRVTNRVIAFCGVHFMAETAAILNPDRIVLLPDATAGCPMADMCSAEDLAIAKHRYHRAVVVCYVNSTAGVKALSDLCCTSSNAVAVLRSIPADREILFVPDRWLGTWAATQTGRTNFALVNARAETGNSEAEGPQVFLWAGHCPTHHNIMAEELEKTASEHPDALICAHPECRTDIVNRAHFVGSTAGIIKFVAASDKRKFIIASEKGMIHAINKVAPDKLCIPASQRSTCLNMKKVTLENLADSLRTLTPRVVVDPETAGKALGSITRMLELSR